MNNNNLQQIFSHYIEKFEYINNPKHNENFKWQVANVFKERMDEALLKDGIEFADALNQVKSITSNMIDSSTQPFNGLVEFSKKEPEMVKQMFLELYAGDGEDLKARQKAIAIFFNKSNELLEKYYPGSYRFKQNFHAVSTYLFLYDPEHHFIFKATQASIFADAIEFYENWGTGENINIEVFYKMCNQLVNAIKDNKELMITDQSRFDKEFQEKTEELFLDKEKHLLAFDIIYCSSVYDLFEGIAFKRPKTKEKKLYNERKKKSALLLKKNIHATEQYKNLQEAKQYYLDTILVGGEVKHKVFGTGIVESIDEKYISVFFPEKKQHKQLGLSVAIANGILTLKLEGFAENNLKYAPVLKREDAIVSRLRRTSSALKPYKEYLE